MAAEDIFTFGAIKEVVALNYGDTSDLTLAKAEKWVNRALVTMTNMYEWSFLKTYSSIAMVSGQELYTLATDIKKLTAVYLRSPVRRKLRLVDDRNFRRAVPDPTISQGSPLYYRIYTRTGASAAQQIALWPIPNNTQTLYYDYIRRISLFTTLGSQTLTDAQDLRTVTEMPDYLLDVVIQMATAYAWQDLDDADKDGQWAKAVEMVREASIYDQHEPDSTMLAAPFDMIPITVDDPVLEPRFGDYW